MHDWGFPLTASGIAFVISAFVTKQGHDIQIWKGNIPGYDFIKNFAATRLATNIKHPLISLVF